MRQADVYLYGQLAGRLSEDENGYAFQYNEEVISKLPRQWQRLAPKGKKSG